MLRIAALLAVLGGTLIAGSAAAQVGWIFGDSPPVPPANVPGGAFPPQPPPVQYPGQPPFRTRPAAPPPTAIQAQPLPPPPGATAIEPVGPSPRGAPQMPPPVQRARVAPPGGSPPGPNGYSPPPPAGYSPAPPEAYPTQANAPPATTTPQTDNSLVIEQMPPEKITNNRAVFSGLDKITGRIISFDAAIGETVQFGALQVTPRVCYTRPPTEQSDTDAFVEVDEVTLQGEIKRIFTGWMFASSPGLHAVEHPIYDVWLTDCASPIQPPEAAVAAAPTPAPAPVHERRSRRRPPPLASSLQPR